MGFDLQTHTISHIFFSQIQIYSRINCRYVCKLVDVNECEDFFSSLGRGLMVLIYIYIKFHTLFEPYQPSLSVHIRLLQSIWSASAHLVQFSLLWSNSFNFVHLEPNRSNFVHFSLFSPLQFKSVYFGPFDPLQSI